MLFRIRPLLASLKRRLLRSRVRWLISGSRYDGALPAEPVSTDFGLSRGRPIDRVYIEQFLSAHQERITGRVLEVGGGLYTGQFGGEAVDIGDVLHVDDSNLQANVIGDLSKPDDFQADQYDCVILTQTLQFIFDLQATVTTLNKILRPGGTLLATVPGISQISRYDMDRWGDYWRFTDAAIERLFGDNSMWGASAISSYGNVRTSAGMLYGLSAEELPADAFTNDDADYQLIIGIAVSRVS
jgi:SAM-dependent methyltransferase